ncbi:MAG: helix-turn-helix domain-containing protein [Cyanobacteriota bacterium]|nr:helix-turn-helix domain-containing protein [Cyanobacteriota bacterium]
MFIGTTEAATLLNITTQRVRVLLKQGRIQGARKINGKTWVIPLYQGMPRISKGKRGPKPKWKHTRHCARNTVHINRQNLGRNQKNQNTDLTVVSAKRNSTNLAVGHEVDIHGPCRIVYRPNKPHNCGATVWIETLAKVTVFDLDGSQFDVDSNWVWEESLPNPGPPGVRQKVKKSIISLTS